MDDVMILDALFAVIGIIFIASPLYLLLSALSNRRKMDREHKQWLAELKIKE